MKKEIKEKLREFQRKEKDIIVAISENPSESKLKADLMKIRSEKKKWLNEVGGFSEDMSLEELSGLEAMVSAADREISRAAKYEASLEEYIAMSAKKIREPQPGYERVVDDKSQMIAIAEQSAMNKVRTLDKFNKKRNKKSFLNVVICKFKKSKQQSQEQEQQGPSQN